MNVTFLTGSVSRLAGGLFTTVRRTAQTLADDGLQVQVVGLEDRFTKQDLPSWESVRPATMPRYGPRSIGYARGLPQELARYSADVLHTQGLWLYVSRAAWNWGRRTSRPYVVSPRGMLDPWALANSRWKKRLAGWLFEDEHLSRAACIHALCESEAKSIRAYGLSNPICIIPNGVDVPGEQSHLPAPWEGRIDRSHKVLLYLGRIHPKKGLPELLDAWSRALSGGVEARLPQDWTLVIAGWSQGGHDQVLQRQARQRGIEDRVLFLGPQFGAAKASSYANCDAFILPSHSEGIPMVVLEAWSYGKPVIMTPECNLPEGFTAGAAICVDPNAESIAKGVYQLASLPDASRQAMGRQGRQLVVERFNWKSVVGQLSDVYAWLLGDAATPDCVVLN